MQHTGQIRSAARTPLKVLSALVPAMTLLVGLSALHPAPAAAVPAPGPTQHFIWTSTASNVSANATLINNAATNSRPGALVFVTPSYDPGGVGGSDTSPANIPMGVLYDPVLHRWAIFNEDQSTMALGLSFNVLVVPQANSQALSVKAAAPTLNRMYLNNPALNANPKAKLIVTQVWNHNASTGIYNNNNIGVWYDTSKAKWAIYNESHSSMPANARFNVLIGSGSSNGGTMVTQKVTNANISGNSTWVINPVSDHNPNVVAFATHVYNLSTTIDNGIYSDHQAAVWYDGRGLNVFNFDAANTQTKVRFFVLIFPS